MGIDTPFISSHQNGQTSTLHVSLGRDIQNSKPSVHVRLGRVGVDAVLQRSSLTLPPDVEAEEVEAFVNMGDRRLFLR